jgi:hypothetical protein
VRPPHPAPRSGRVLTHDAIACATVLWATWVPAKLPAPRAAGTPKASRGDVVINYTQTVACSSRARTCVAFAHVHRRVRARPLLRTTHKHVNTFQGRVLEDASALHRDTHAPHAACLVCCKLLLAAEAQRARMKEGGNEIFITHHVVCGCVRVCSSSVGTPTSTKSSTPGTKPQNGTPQNACKARDVTSAEFDAEAKRVGEKQEGENQNMAPRFCRQQSVLQGDSAPMREHCVRIAHARKSPLSVITP